LKKLHTTSLALTSGQYLITYNRDSAD